MITYNIHLYHNNPSVSKCNLNQISLSKIEYFKREEH